jgi:hypothetical protein
MAQSDLSKAKNGKNDEFYTQFIDIEKEMNAYLEFDPREKLFYYHVMTPSGVILQSFLHRTFKDSD